MSCKCYEKRQEKKKWKAVKSAKEMHSKYGCRVVVDRGLDNLGNRMFTILAVSEKCPKHRWLYISLNFCSEMDIVHSLCRIKKKEEQ
ncbi:hypothetical protein [Bacillus rhizoplanae]|uniref:hypothetical protein n=1 Tax=Bacillus rhizoplanae TaxID=2880966 RepID=UPI003D1BE01B